MVRIAVQLEILITAVIVLTMAACGHTRSCKVPFQDKAGILSHLEKHGISEGINTVLYKKVLDRVRAMPYLAIYDSEQRLLYEKLGYSRKLNQEVGKVLAGHYSPPGKNLRMMPIKNLDGTWFDPKKLPTAKFFIYEFWTTWCESCTKQMNALHEFLSGSPYKDQVHLIRVYCGPFDFKTTRQQGEQLDRPSELAPHVGT